MHKCHGLRPHVSCCVVKRLPVRVRHGAWDQRAMGKCPGIVPAICLGMVKTDYRCAGGSLRSTRQFVVAVALSSGTACPRTCLVRSTYRHPQALDVRGGRQRPTMDPPGCIPCLIHNRDGETAQQPSVTPTASTASSRPAFNSCIAVAPRKDSGAPNVTSKEQKMDKTRKTKL